MAAAVINFAFNPLSGFWAKCIHTFEIVGYSRAAAELARHGLYKESQRLYEHAAELRSN
jgi:hypothetical protein|tara:strand:+ start:41 stop:217 length:177 start_codon:yes stop_codon:yes gene_type:complete